MQGMPRVALSAGLVAAVLAAAPAAAGPESFRVTVAKDANGPFTGASPEVRVGNKPKDFFMRARNRSTEMLDIELRDFSFEPGTDDDFRIKWYRGGREITEDTQGAGHSFLLDADERRTFRALVKPRVPNPGPLCLMGRFDVPSTGFDYLGYFFVNSSTAC